MYQEIHYLNLILLLLGSEVSKSKFEWNSEGLIIIIFEPETTVDKNKWIFKSDLTLVVLNIFAFSWTIHIVLFF